jgi:hypothetical protein
MSSQPDQPPDRAAPVEQKWPRRQSGLRQFAEIILVLGLFALLKKLNSDGILLPGLSRGQFLAVLLGGLAVLALALHLVGRRAGRDQKLVKK